MESRWRLAPVGYLVLFVGVLPLSGCGGGNSELKFYKHDAGNFRARGG